MKFSLKTLLALALVGLAAPSSATTTLVFGLAGTNRATGFANFAGVATNGMRWGLVIDTAGDGFDNTFPNTTYDAFVNSASGFISASVNSISIGATDDYFFTPGSLPTTSFQSATGTDPGGDGGIVSAASAPNGTDGIIPGVTTNDSFAIIWFDGVPSLGSHYGTFADASFQIPASGTTVNRNAPFIGGVADALKPASLSFTNIPEPSRLMLLGLGAVGLIFRRRRN